MQLTKNHCVKNAFSHTRHIVLYSALTLRLLKVYQPVSGLVFPTVFINI